MSVFLLPPLKLDQVKSQISKRKVTLFNVVSPIIETIVSGCESTELSEKKDGDCRKEGKSSGKTTR